MNISKSWNICPLCSNVIDSESEANVDHILPKSKGGTNIIKNLQIVHKSCNSQKDSRMTEQCKEKAIAVYPHLREKIIKIKVVHIFYNVEAEYFNKTGKRVNALIKQQATKKYRRYVETSFTPSTAPMDLFNEFSRNGMTNLSYDRILEYFEAYKNHNGYKIEVKETE